MNNKKNTRYVVLTAARNEEKNIEKTIQSVIYQTIKPVQWIIISDGSTDRTDEIVLSYAKKNNFIKFFRASGEKLHSFGSKVKAINFAKSQVTVKEYDYIGILDADISFSSDYFKEVITRFDNNPRLGLGGGIIYQVENDRTVKQNIDVNSVAGAVQLFRRRCFEQLGDFLPLQYGGEDAAMEIKAKMNSWEVRTFPELHVMHYGFVGRGAGNLLKGKFNTGIRFYQLGYHPLFQVFRCTYRVIDWPYVIGSVAELCGYFKCLIKKEKIMLPEDTVAFLRKEQMQRLNIFKRH